MRIDWGALLKFIAVMLVAALLIFPTQKRLGVKLRMSYHLDEAEQSLLVAYRKNPESRVLLENLADLYADRGEAEQQEFFLKKLLERYPQQGVFYDRLVELYRWDGNYEELARVLEMRDRNLGRDTSNLRALLDVYEVQGDHRRLRLLLGRVHDLFATDAELQATYRWLLAEAGEYGELAELLARLTEQHPSDLALRMEFAEVYWAQGKLDSCGAILLAHTRKNPSLAGWRETRSGLVEFGLDSLLGGFLLAMAQTFPRQDSLELQAALAFRRAGLGVESAQGWEAHLRHHPEDHEARWELARTLAWDNRTLEEVHQLELLREAGWNLPEVLSALEERYAWLDDSQRRLQVLEELALLPGSVGREAWQREARLLQDLGRQAELESGLRKRMAAGDAEALRMLLQLWAGGGMTVEQAVELEGLLQDAANRPGQAALPVALVRNLRSQAVEVLLGSVQEPVAYLHLAALERADAERGRWALRQAQLRHWAGRLPEAGRAGLRSLEQGAEVGVSVEGGAVRGGADSVLLPLARDLFWGGEVELAARLLVLLDAAGGGGVSGGSGQVGGLGDADLALAPLAVDSLRGSAGPLPAGLEALAARARAQGLQLAGGAEKLATAVDGAAGLNERENARQRRISARALARQAEMQRLSAQVRQMLESGASEQLRGFLRGPASPGGLPQEDWVALFHWSLDQNLFAEALEVLRRMRSQYPFVPEEVRQRAAAAVGDVRGALGWQAADSFLREAGI